MQIEFTKELFNDVYLPTYQIKTRYLILWGGAGSGKSVWAIQSILLRMMKEEGHRFLFFRKVAKTIKRSQFQLAEDIITQWGLHKYFNFRRSDLEIEYKPNKNKILTAGLDDPEKIKSIVGITGAWGEEANELMPGDLREINRRIRGFTKNYKQIILSYNPINEKHWLNSKFHASIIPEIIDYNLKNVSILHTTYKDNKFLDKEYTEELEALKHEDENEYNIYTLGLWGRLENLIYKPFEIIDSYPESFDETIYGLDFGFNNPSALLEINIKDQEYYLRELLYQSGLTNADLIEKLKQLIPNKTSLIYADSAEPARIEEIYKAGFVGIKPANKSVKDGIDFVRRIKCYSLHANENLNAERDNYQYKKDKSGNILTNKDGDGEPVKENDHLECCLRYGTYTHNISNVVVSTANRDEEERTPLFNRSGIISGGRFERKRIGLRR